MKSIKELKKYKINETKIWFFGKSNRFEKHLARLTKNKRRIKLLGSKVNRGHYYWPTEMERI